jgi:gliding motility-associated-like protein
LVSIDYVVKVATANGCQASDSIKITLLCGETFYFPTAFTPNGDGLNDKFYILGGGATVNFIRIFNRWGKLVFERKNIPVNDISQGWDGTFEGNMLPAGSYIYTAALQCFNGKSFDYRGSVMMIR